MSILDTLITNRTQADVDELESILAVPLENWSAETLAEFNLARSKGSYNYTDLNRVTQAMDYINNQLVGYGYATGYQKIKIPRKSGSRLPEGYTELEYIQSSGTQYINTGVNPNQNTRIICDTNLAKQNTAAWLFGARNGSGDSTFGFLTYQNAYRSDYNTNQDQTISDTYTGFFTVDKDKNVTKINGETKITNAGGTFQTSYPLFLFANNNGGSVAGYSSCAIQACQIYDNGTLIRDYVPAKNSSGIVGLYDVVNNEFYQNAGTGVFTAGPEVGAEPEVDEELDPYTWYESDIPTASLMTAYLSNVEAIRSTLEVMATTPEAPESMEALTWVEANNIEQILVDVQTIINRVVNGMARSNSFTFWSGNRPFPTAESNLGRTWAELDAMDTEWKNWQVATWYLLLYGNLQAEGVVS